MPQLVDLGKLRFYFAGDYNPATTYEMNDVVKYGGNVYVYISVLATSGNLPTDVAYWSLMVEGINFRGPYVPGTTYQIGDGVAHGGKVYVAIANNILNQTPPNPTYWSQFVDGIQYEGEWSNVASYQKNDVVVYGAKVYIAKVDNSGVLPTDPTFWDKFVDGIGATGVYNNATAYVTGDVVAYGAVLYIAKTETTGNLPTNSTYWDLFTSGIAVKNAWTTATQYYPNDVVTRGGNTYIALQAHVAGTFTTDLAAAKWEKFNGGIAFRGTFTPGTYYYAGDVVYDGLDALIATDEFTAGATIADNAADWELLAKGADYLPSQLGQGGKLLGTDGTDPLWTTYVNKIQVGLGVEDFETNAALTDVVASFQGDSESFAQIAFRNSADGLESSADIIVYSDNGTNDVGFMDMGITNSKFDSTTYGITGPGDGYIFANGVPPVVASVSNTSLTDNVATYTTSAAHEFVAGRKVTVTGITNAVYNVTDATIVATPTPTTFTVAITNANIGSTAASGTASMSGGKGDLVIATGDGGERNAIVFAAGGYASGNTQMTIIPDVNVHIEIPTPSTSSSTGALTVVGGVGVQGDMNIEGDLSVQNGGIEAKDFLYVGADAVDVTNNIGADVKAIFKTSLTANEVTITTATPHKYLPFQSVIINVPNNSAVYNGEYEITEVLNNTQFKYAKVNANLAEEDNAGTVSAVTGLTNPVAVFTADFADFTQIAFQNVSSGANSSTDFIAYPDNGGDMSGFIDLGITSSNFADPEFTITGPNDGYIFMDAPAGTTGEGNLVLATGANGTANKIVFAAGGLQSNNTQMVITPGVNVHIEIPTASISPTTGALTIVGGVGISGDVNIAGAISFGGSGTTVTTANLAVSDPLIFVGQDNPANAYELGLIAEYALPTTLDPSATVTAAAIQGNLATLSLTYAPGAEKFRVNDSVVITGVDATFNGTYTVVATTNTSISYAKTAADVTLTGLSGAANATDVNRPKWAGFVRDNADGVWKLFSDASERPTSGSVNFTGVTYDSIRVGGVTAQAVTASGTVTAPTVVVNNAPTAVSHAVRKDYVDDAVYAPHPFMMAAM